MNLERIGWNDYFEEKLKDFINNLESKDFRFKISNKKIRENKELLRPARVEEVQKNLSRLFTEKGEMYGVFSREMHELAEIDNLIPAVGDWVVINYREDGKAVIHGILERKTKFIRKTPGIVSDKQVIAANIDNVFIVTGLNQDFNLSRIERYMTIAWDCGAKPIIILNKADLCEDADEKLSQTENIAFGTPVILMSALIGDGISQLEEFIQPGETSMFLGSSGVGKSTIINALLDEDRLKTQDISEAMNKGKHTTTYRQMILLPDGGIVIDTPGLREIQMLKGVPKDTFQDVEYLMTKCAFRSCTHTGEPGCAVQEAIDSGELSEKRYRNYKKLLREIAYNRRKACEKANRVRRKSKQEWRNKIKKMRQFDGIK